MKASWAFALAIAALAACTPPSPQAEAPGADPTSPARCEQAATRNIAFFGADAKDVLEIAASGVDCARTVVTVSIRSPNGPPEMAFAVPLGRLQTQIDLTRAVTPEELAAFLKTYAEAAQFDAAASTLPEWKTNTPGPGFDDGYEISSPLDRETYEALRTAKPNMLCLMDTLESSACYVWDPKSARAEVIVRGGG